MDWIRKILGYKKPEKEVKINTSFTIQHYPLSGRFYPKVDGFYIQKRISTGNFEKRDEELFCLAEFGKSLDEALEIIKEYKELNLKENCKTINVIDLD